MGASGVLSAALLVATIACCLEQAAVAADSAREALVVDAGDRPVDDEHNHDQQIRRELKEELQPLM